MNQVIVTTPEQLYQTVQQAVAEALANIQQPGDEKAWTYQQCADYLGVSLNTLRQMVDQKQIPYFELPTGASTKRAIRFHPHEVRNWKPSNQTQVNYQLKRKRQYGYTNGH